jgi:hypothetical protein
MFICSMLRVALSIHGTNTSEHHLIDKAVSIEYGLRGAP